MLSGSRGCQLHGPRHANQLTVPSGAVGAAGGGMPSSHPAPTDHPTTRVGSAIPSPPKMSPNPPGTRNDPHDGRGMTRPRRIALLRVARQLESQTAPRGAPTAHGHPGHQHTARRAPTGEWVQPGRGHRGQSAPRASRCPQTAAGRGHVRPSQGQTLPGPHQE